MKVIPEKYVYWFFLIDLLRVYIAFALCRGCWLSVMYIIHCFMFCCFCLLSCWLSVMYITFAVFVYIAFVVYVCLSWWLSFRYIIVFYVFVCYDSWPLGYLFWGSLTVRIVGCLLWLPMVLLVLCCVWLLADDSMLCFCSVIGFSLCLSVRLITVLQYLAV
jgi:hypothetical protein